MKNSVYTTPEFDKQFKKFKKKFRSLEKEMSDLIELLEKEPEQGTKIGDNLFKIRLACKSKGTGKSGGFRVITFNVEVEVNDNETYLITLYDKSERENIPKNKLHELIKKLFPTD